MLLDTNVAVDLRDARVATVTRFAALGELPLLSIFTRFELEGGVYARPAISATRRARLDAMLAEIRTLDFDVRVVSAYGRIVEACGFSRRKIMDRMIAATAIVHDLTLITSNPADFADIPDLRLEVWPAQ